MNKYGGVGPDLRQKRDQEELELALGYLCATRRGQDPLPLLMERPSVLARLGGIEGLHGYLWAMGALEDDWDELLDASGLITIEAVSEEGSMLVHIEHEDHEAALNAVF